MNDDAFEGLSDQVDILCKICESFINSHAEDPRDKNWMAFVTGKLLIYSVISNLGKSDPRTQLIQRLIDELKKMDEEE